MNTKTIYLILGLVILVIVGFYLFNSSTTPVVINNSNNTTLTTLTNQTNMTAQNGDLVSVNYTGTLIDGTKFDSSLDHGKPIQFTLGVGQVIKGWDQGIVGMKIGDKKKLTIPPELAYGAQAIPDARGGILIPANSTLIFDVELVDVKR